MINDLRILSIKDIMELSGVSKNTASKIKQNIIKDLFLTRSYITLLDYKKYYCMS